MMSPHPGSSPSSYRWHEDGGFPKQPTPTPMGGEGGQGEQIFSPQQPGTTSPDPYAFPSPGSDPFSPTRTGPRPLLRLPGLQTFGSSSPQEEDSSVFSAMGARVRPGSDPFSPSSDQMMMAGPRRPSGEKDYEFHAYNQFRFFLQLRTH